MAIPAGAIKLASLERMHPQLTSLGRQFPNLHFDSQPYTELWGQGIEPDPALTQRLRAEFHFSWLALDLEFSPL